MSHKLYTALIVVALGLGIYIGKSAFSKTETVEIEKETIKRDVVTVVKEIVKPDGTRETETVTTDKSKEKRDSSTSVTQVAPPRPDWHFSVSAAYLPSDGSNRLSLGSLPVYGLQIERRVLGPFSAGLRIQSDKQIGIVIGMEF